MRLFFKKILLLLFLVSVIPGCETLQNFKFKESEKDKEQATWDAKNFLDAAKSAMEKENFTKAIELYETLEARYPFDEYTAQAQLDVAYAYYKNDDTESAIAAAERFIKIHPRSSSVDYAYYLKGLVNFNKSIGFIDRYLPTDSTQRNPSNVKQAYENFEELIRRFPDSKYVPDAKQRILALRNNLAMYEVHVARFYLKRRAYVAAANRGSYVVKEYQRAPAVPYALLVMQEAYTKLGLDDLAADAKRVYEQNYPDGPPIRDNNEATMANQIWDFFGLDN